MQQIIIVIYEKNELAIQMSEVVNNGVLKIVELNRSNKVILEDHIGNTDFIRTQVELTSGKYKIQIISSAVMLTKKLTISR